MKITLKKIIKNIAPPILIHAYEFMIRNTAPTAFYGKYASLEEIAPKLVDNYNLDVSASFSLEKTKSYLNKINLFDTTERKFYLTLLVKEVSMEKPFKDIKILDFGGGTGWEYVHIFKFLPQIKESTYIIVETPKVVETLKDIFDCEHHIKGITELRQFTGVDICVCSGTLQYTGNYKNVISNLLDSNPRHIFLSRIPTSDDETYLTIQKSGFLNTTHWVFNLDELKEIFLRKKYTLKDSWAETEEWQLDNLKGKKFMVKFSGMIFSSNPSAVRNGDSIPLEKSHFPVQKEKI